MHRSATSLVVYADDFGVSEEYRDVAMKRGSGDAHAQTEADFIGALHDLSKRGFRGARDLTVADRDGDGGSTAGTDTAHYSSYFRHCDVNNDKTITPDEFVDFCETMFGRSRRVAMKFMKNEDQWRRERSMRGKDIDGVTASGSGQDTDVEDMETKALDTQYVVGLMDGPKDADFQEAVKSFRLEASGEPVVLAEYKYGIVMPAADRTLDAIYRSEVGATPYTAPDQK